MKGLTRRWRTGSIAVIAALLFAGAASGQEFSNSSMNGVYAFIIGPQTMPGVPGPTHVRWVLAEFHGDGNWTIDLLGVNIPRPGDEVGRDVTVGQFSMRGTYEVNPDGTILFYGGDGTLAWDGLILRSEMGDGGLVATEYALFNRVPDDVTGALRMGIGTLQRPVGSQP